MPNVPEGKALANFLIDKELERRVIEYWHANQLPNKTAAYVALIHKGLEASKEGTQ